MEEVEGCCGCMVVGSREKGCLVAYRGEGYRLAPSGHSGSSGRP